MLCPEQQRIRHRTAQVYLRIALRNLQDALDEEAGAAWALPIRFAIEQIEEIELAIHKAAEQ